MLIYTVVNDAVHRTKSEGAVHNLEIVFRKNKEELKYEGI